MRKDDDDDAPGLKVRQRKGGDAFYWVAGAVTRKAGGYPVKTVRLHYANHEERAARCRVLTAELRQWLAGQGKRSTVFTGSLHSLITCYQQDEDSPYRDVKWNTREHYDDSLSILDRAVGKRRIADLTRKDFARWHKNFKAPAEPGGPERLRRAYNAMKVLRIILSYGLSMRYAGCTTARAILHEMKFELPERRESAPTYAQALAIIDHALEIGRPSIALAQALQFELSLRQKDVIGEWVDAEGGKSGIVNLGKRWTGGITWSALSGNVLRKKTTKTAATGEWDVSRHDLLVKALAAFEPIGERVGPMIVSERHGLPYSYREFYRDWRAIADAAGVPKDIWNMDSRAGALTEGADAGAVDGDLQKAATHASVKTTNRYIRRTLAATTRVADLRAERRAREQTKKGA